MTYRGHVENGVVVIDDPVALPEGAKVRIELSADVVAASNEQPKQTLGQKLMKHAGKAAGLPTDAARNHDHYLYGTPRTDCISFVVMETERLAEALTADHHFEQAGFVILLK